MHTGEYYTDSTSEREKKNETLRERRLTQIYYTHTHTHRERERERERDIETRDSRDR